MSFGLTDIDDNLYLRSLFNISLACANSSRIICLRNRILGVVIYIDSDRTV